MNEYYLLTKDEWRELSERIVRGEVTPDPAEHRDDFEFSLDCSGREVRGSYNWDDDEPTDWELEIGAGGA